MSEITIASSSEVRVWDLVSGRERCTMSVHSEIQTPDASRQHAYLAVLRAVVLYERGKGAAATDLERRWSISNLEGVEEQWRDTMLWMTAAFSKILETRCFFYCQLGQTS
jgi:hypothetical protein